MRCLLVLMVGFALVSHPPAFSAPVLSSPAPVLTPVPNTALAIASDERAYFQLGDTLARAAFAYAELAQEAAKVGKIQSQSTQMSDLAKLAPLALRDRATACDGFTRAEKSLTDLDAPLTALAPISEATTLLRKPQVFTGDIEAVAVFNKDAAVTLAGLQEYEQLSSIPQSPRLTKWLSSNETDRSSHVWYAEGVLTGLADIAATYQSPDLLPPRAQIATDLRGLRDWLVLRLPENPSPEQIALRKSLDTFLNEGMPRSTAKKVLTATQLQALGTLSRALQAQILSIPDNVTSPTVPLPLLQNHSAIPSLRKTDTIGA